MLLLNLDSPFETARFCPHPLKGSKSILGTNIEFLQINLFRSSVLLIMIRKTIFVLPFRGRGRRREPKGLPGNLYISSNPYGFSIVGRRFVCGRKNKPRINRGCFINYILIPTFLLKSLSSFILYRCGCTECRYR